MKTRAPTHARTALRYLGASRRARVGAGILLALALACGLGSLIVPLPSPTGVEHGGTTVLGTAVVAVAAATALGALVGTIYALAGPRHNRGLERWLEAVDTFPAIVVVALFRTIQEHPSNLPVVAAVAIVKWAEVARIVRAEALRLATEDFVTAARALGATRLSIATRHVLPHVAAPLLADAFRDAVDPKAARIQKSTG